MEHDFTMFEDTRLKFQTVDFNLQESHQRFTGCHQQNIVPSLQNFDDFTELLPLPFESKEFNVDLTLDTSEDKHDYFYLLKLSNVHPEVKHKALFNLFSLYGNIEKISLDSQSRNAVIFYPTEFEQITASHCLSNLVLFACPLLIQTSKISKQEVKSMNLPNLVSYKKTNEVTQITALSKLRVINKPLHVLYVFNLSPNASLDMIRNLFDMYVPVINIYYSNESKNSALVFFRTVEDAAKILCLFKNTMMIDKSLKINFANNNLLKGKDMNQRKNKFVSLQNFNDCSPVLDFETLIANKPKKGLNFNQPAFKISKSPFAV
jgi:hypothetical protein